MPADPLTRLDRAEARLAKAREAVERATEDRRVAIAKTHAAGVSIGDIAAHLGVTHEAVRQVVRAQDGAVRPYRRRSA